MKLRTPKFLELVGGAIVFVTAFLQVPIYLVVEREARAAEAKALEYRLAHIYHAVRGEPYASPAWEDIDRVVGTGKSATGDGHFSFDEARDFVQVALLILTALGGVALLAGKYMELLNESRNEKLKQTTPNSK